jgi:hypothetical protein
MRENIEKKCKKGTFFWEIFANQVGETLGWVLEALLRGPAHTVACILV